jgi:guanosine-3',5'-bis(diphosphate) 3'-pyrophosphohydrolase
MTTGHPWQAAAALAARAHRDQLRRDGRTPYFSHPVRVAMTVASVFGCTDETVLTAALLHDIIEDTRVDYDDLLKNFGREVADIVSCLSKDKRMVESERETEYDRRLAAGPWQARLVKLADVYDNLADTPSADDGTAVLDRARRAIRIAGADPRLARAVESLRGAVRAAEEGARKA